MMKTGKYFIAVLLAGGLFTACKNKQADSTKIAEESNAQKIDSAENNSSASQHSTMPASVTESDSKFMVEAADGGMAEVQMGEIAGREGVDERVREFGEMMEKDHTKGGDELKKLAKDKNVTLPASISEENMQNKHKLMQKTGKDFDKTYMNMMVEDHEKDIKEFKDAAQNCNDADIKAWAEKTLPVLQKHLDSAKAIKKALNL
jgi:putative membrane protein